MAALAKPMLIIDERSQRRGLDQAKSRPWGNDCRPIGQLGPEVRLQPANETGVPLKYFPSPRSLSPTLPTRSQKKLRQKRSYSILSIDVSNLF
jgi:hypothetical protein